MGEFWVLCINVECYGSTRMASTEAEAIAAWNRRADASTIATLRKALQTTEDRVHRMEDVIAGCETCSAALDEKGE